MRRIRADWGSVHRCRRAAMPRTPRRQQWTDEAAYHVLSRGHNRETVFADAEDRRFFLGLLDRYRRRTGLRLYHYCLISNHFHLLLQLDPPGRLSALMAGLLRAYVHYFNRRHGFVGHLWQGRFRSPAVDVEPYFLGHTGTYYFFGRKSSMSLRFDTVFPAPGA